MCRRNNLLIVLVVIFSFLPYWVYGQKVGLVLSGGGAKGLTHIGVIRALEENNIPIDYITGTSMGAIIGSLYAMGYSPDEMEELISSEDFRRWYSGEVEEKYRYYFKENSPTPEFVNIRFAFNKKGKGAEKLKSQFLPSSVVNPIQMNLVFIDLYARATAACKGNFNKLMVPFRCIASDVYNKHQVIMREGDLGDAVRASMSFPLMFKPIQMDSVLMYDGGIYNNFPADVMHDDFHPDIVIGSVVSSNPKKPDEKDLMGQMETMVMQKSDYTLGENRGILMTFKYTDVNLMDFPRIKEMHDNGYNRTMQMMDSIKGLIHRRISAENVLLRRKMYRSICPELRFKNIYIEGANKQQQNYIKREFHSSDNKEFTYEDLKVGYFRLLSGNMISEVIPHAVYNIKDGTYDLYLKVKVEDKFSVRIGGNASTSGFNQIYLGLNYQDLNNYAKEVAIDGHLGKVYSNVQLMGKLDLPTHIPTSFRLIASYSTFDYYKEKFLSSDHKPAFNKKVEQFLKLKVALPFMSNKRAEFGLGMASIQDRYFQNSVIDFRNDKYDKSSYGILGGSISFNGSTLNSRQYPYKGGKEELNAQIYTTREKYYPGTNGSYSQQTDSWLQITLMKEKYHSLGKNWYLGWFLKGYYSSRNFSENYTATMMQAGEFAPTPYMQLIYNEAFRANQYLSAGIRPIYQINSMLHVRAEFYGFLPIFPIERNSLNQAYYGKAFSRFEYIGELALVCHLPFGMISAYVNHSSSPKKDWNFGLSLGWQLFNYRFFE